MGGTLSGSGGITVRGTTVWGTTVRVGTTVGRTNVAFPGHVSHVHLGEDGLVRVVKVQIKSSRSENDSENEP